MSSLPSIEACLSFENFEQSLAFSIAKGPESNGYEYAFATDFNDLLKYEAIQGAVNEALRMREEVDKELGRSPMSISYAGNMIFRLVHAELFDIPGYPNGFNIVNTWREPIVETVMGEDFAPNLMTRDVMSNIPSRYVTARMIATLLAKRQGHPIDFTDIGGSQGHGAKMLSAGMPFKKPHNAPMRGKMLKTFGHLLDDKVMFGQLIVVDKWDPEKDPEIKKWAMACSIPPHELSEKRIAAYRELDDLLLPNVHFLQDEVGWGSFLQSSDDHKAWAANGSDLVFASTVMYQMAEKRIERSLEEMKSILKPGGVLVVQDHMRVVRGQLKEMDNWYNPRLRPYRTFLYDSLHPEKELVEVSWWTNGRCKTGSVSGVMSGQRALSRLAIAA